MSLTTRLLMIAAAGLPLAVAACGSLTTGTSATTSAPATTRAPAIAWTDAQTAYVELTSYQAAQSAALVVAQAPGLSAKAVDEIKTGEGLATGAVTGQAQALAQGGDAEAQAVSAVTTAASGAVSSIVAVVTAQHGTTNADAEALGVAGGIAALSDAPAILTAVMKVNGGYQPTTADLTALLSAINGVHQQIQQLGQPQGA